MKRPAVFLDRDGTVMEEVHYCNDPEKVRLYDGVPQALRKLKQAGYHTVVITNQSGIARGIISPEAYNSVHARLLQLLGPDTLDATYFCADGPECPSNRRKPAPGMLLEAAADLQIDLENSWMIGDREIDVACAKNAGVKGILVKTGYGATIPECGAYHIAEHLPEAVEWILSQTSL